MRKKFSEIQTKRSILKNIPKTQNKNLIKAGIGCDYARLFLAAADEVAVAQGVSIIEDLSDIRYDFIKLYNNLRAGGTVPFALTNAVMMPSEDEKYMKKILISLGALAQMYQVDIITGHTEISDAVNSPIITMTMAGRCCYGTSGLSPANIMPGMDIVMCGQTGVMGTVKLLSKHKEGLQSRYSATYLNGAERLKEYMALRQEADIAIEEGIVYSHDISTGGVYAALWEMADAANAGISISHDAIPIMQETVEICEYTGHNPYMIDGSGAVLFVTPYGDKLSERLYKEGYEASVIGRITNDNDRIIIHDDEKRFLTPPKYDTFL